jgi:cephalosporin hydroxylase/glycosyltransferase involved in cell wall biosynthesis
MTVGGVVVVDDFVDEGCRRAVEAFRTRRGIDDPMEKVDWACVAWRVLTAPEAETSTTGASRPQAEQHANAPLAPDAPPGRRDLSVVIVLYNMRREAARSLHALSRAYQRDVDGLDYEVIVVENGSDPDRGVDKQYVRSFGPEFRFIDLGRDATPSPVDALNAGIRVARGDAFALMIDGAHVLTPGVLHYGMLGLSAYAPAIVATQQWYLGPGQQGDAMSDGYGPDLEDRLLDEIEWPTDGYRLFDVGNFVGDRDWLDGLWESNCLFVTRDQLQQAGGFDESFSMPGGGYANLDIYERLGAAPGVTVATMLGEGSFHQVHGGTTTNLTDVDERHRRLASYSEHFVGLRGRGFRGHGKKIHYIGTMTPDIARTRARRRFSPNTFAAAADGPDGRPREPIPVPQDLRTEFIDAYWRSLRWRETTWLGRRLPKLPTDLFVYQELLSTVRPDWIVETGTGNGGRAWFLATVCELLGHGRVLSIDAKPGAKRPVHDRITYHEGIPHEPESGALARDTVGGGRALVILGTRSPAGKILKEFDNFAPLVPVGSYVVVEDTIVNGHPVWANFGRGPAEAVKSIVEARGDFMSDLTMERYVMTFNPTGFLKRVSG